MKFSDLIGLVLVSVVNKDDEEIIFTTTDGRQFRLYHEQDCCESVSVEDITGDLADLVGPVVLAEESSEEGKKSEWGDSSTWTFYRIGTAKGTVVIRWFGQSNGYYSERVDFEEITK